MLIFKKISNDDIDWFNIELNDGVTMNSLDDLSFDTVGIDESILLSSYMTFKISEDKFGIPVTIKITILYANIICEYDVFNSGFNNLLLETTGNYDISSNVGSLSQLVNNTTIDISNLKYDVATISIYSIVVLGVYFKIKLVGSLSLHFSTSVESGLQYTKKMVLELYLILTK